MRREFHQGRENPRPGDNFKGALTYYLHDKKTLETAERVSFVEMGNLVTTDPYEAWREMMVTAEAADQLKSRAGLKPGGRKNTQPVYCFSINWHPDDRPSIDHQRQTALDCLRFMELTDHQYVIVRPRRYGHPNVHITVNMIHPETGRSLQPLQGPIQARQMVRHLRSHHGRHPFARAQGEIRGARSGDWNRRSG